MGHQSAKTYTQKNVSLLHISNEGGFFWNIYVAEGVSHLFFFYLGLTTSAIAQDIVCFLLKVFSSFNNPGA